METIDHVLAEFNGILRSLHIATHGDRVTLRLDCAPWDWRVDEVVAESCTTGVPSLVGDDRIPQRDLATVQHIERTGTVLVQPDVTVASVRPPSVLLTQYHVKAQMLGPIFRQHHLVGWISVHDTHDLHEWDSVEVTELGRAIDEIRRVLDAGGCGDVLQNGEASMNNHTIREGAGKG